MSKSNLEIINGFKHDLIYYVDLLENWQEVKEAIDFHK